MDYMDCGWNHNLHYLPLVLSEVPQPCAHALDIGCGEGVLVRELARRCGQVTGLDLDPRVIAQARSAAVDLHNVCFVVGDVLSVDPAALPGVDLSPSPLSPVPARGFEFLSAVAVLHHLPLEEALGRFADSLAPGGVLVVIGLYRPQGVRDRLFAAVGRLASEWLRRRRRFVPMQAPQAEPRHTLEQVRSAARSYLPGSVLKRRLLFRYSLVWRKPDAQR